MSDQRDAENKVVDLMDALERSVREARAARERRERTCPGCSTDGSNPMGLQGHLPTCIYNAPVENEHSCNAEQAPSSDVGPGND